MKIAVLHEWLTDFAGAENVLEQIVRAVNPSQLMTLVDHMTKGRRAFLNEIPITTSFIQKLPFSKSKYRGYLPLMPMAVEQFDVSEFDVVVSSHYSVCHGVLTRPDQPHLTYTHSPVRYAWDLQHQYLNESGLAKKRIRGSLARAILHYLRVWDHAAGQRPDYFSANSKFIARRIEKCYRRQARVIYPPVDVDRFSLTTEPREDFYVTASRMVPYKRISLIVEAFTRMPNRHLVVIGDGPEFDRIRRLAGKNVAFLGYQSDAVLTSHLKTARAFIFAALEDFGILPVEAQACGTPVIALGRGGTAETVVDGETGILFDEQSVESLLQGIQRFEAVEPRLDRELIRRHAEKFSVERFRNEFSDYVEESLKDFRSKLTCDSHHTR